MSPDTELLFDKLKADNTSSDGLPVSALAFLGDGVYGLMVREYLTVSGRCKADKLHERNIEMVNATYQAKASQLLLPILSEEEKNKKFIKREENLKKYVHQGQKYPHGAHPEK